MRVDHGAHIRLAALERRDLGGAQRMPSLHQPVVGRPRLPEDLIHRPRHHSGLLEAADLPRRVTGQRLRKLVAGSSELARRQTVQIVDF